MTLNLESLLRIPDIDSGGGYSLSPDGQRLAFAWNKTGQSEIYELTLPLSTSHFPLTAFPQLSTGPGGKASPRYSRNGKYLAWVCDTDGSENFHILLHELSTGQTRDLTPDIDFTIQSFFAWSPDSQKIAYLSDQSGNFDLYIINVDSPPPAGEGTGERAAPVFSPGGPAYFVRWAPDGRHIAVSAEQKWPTDGIFIVPLNGDLAWRIGGAQNQLDTGHPAWSPDGKKLAFVSSANGWSQVGIYHLEEDRIEWMTYNESEKYTPAWSPDGTTLAWIDNYGETAWVEVCFQDGTRQRVQTEPGFAYWPTFSLDGKSIFFIYENPHHPVDLWMASLDNWQLTQLTDSMLDEFRSAEFAAPEAITYPSLDGTPIPAMLYKPKDVGPHSPAVVVIHGGPGWHLGYFWNPFLAHLASRGWTVITPNYRGSTGYGRDWMFSNRYEMGRIDSDDCSAAAIYLAQNGLADPKRIAVTGRSHGGYLTMTCMTRNPEIFAVGSAVVPFLNWFTGHENSREDLQYWDIQNMGDPVKKYDLWYERSPFFFLDKVQAPVQFICGENDPRCPPSESVEAHKKLQEHGIESELLLYQGEGHGFLKLENVIDSEKKRIAFLAKVLEKE